MSLTGSELCNELPRLLSPHYDESCSNELNNPSSSHSPRQTRSDMTGTYLPCFDVIVLMAFQRGITSPLSSVTFSFFIFFPSPSLPTHTLSFHRTLSPRHSAFNFALITPFLPGSVNRISFFDLQELFDLLTDLLYLYDLAMSFQQHLHSVYVCVGLEGRGRLPPPQFVQEKKKKAFRPLSSTPSPEKCNYPPCFRANTEARQPSVFSMAVDVAQMFPTSFFRVS